MRISNADIYKKLLDQDSKLEKIEQHVIKTNGQVKLARWMATTAISLVVVALGIIFAHMKG
jgi:hypothetical protein